jgi:two-component system nitrogen regulation response regulator GlnG
MPVSSSVFTLLLVTTDQDLQAQFKQVFKEATVTVARDASILRSKHQFDAVIVETHAGRNDPSSLTDDVDPSRTLFITGSRSVLKRAVKVMQPVNRHGAHTANGKVPDTSLEGYLEMKMGDFVKGMRNGSARNLHPILIAAVERPLITSALRETHGNQIQAAELLGLNRNTLRKKIADLHIPLKRTGRKSHRTD